MEAGSSIVVLFAIDWSRLGRKEGAFDYQGVERTDPSLGRPKKKARLSFATDVSAV
jgi:hypothetical protein